MKGKNRMDKVRIGIIGIGNMGSGHANNIKMENARRWN